MRSVLDYRFMHSIVLRIPSISLEAEFEFPQKNGTLAYNIFFVYVQRGGYYISYAQLHTSYLEAIAWG